MASWGWGYIQCGILVKRFYLRLNPNNIKENNGNASRNVKRNEYNVKVRLNLLVGIKVGQRIVNIKGLRLSYILSLFQIFVSILGFLDTQTERC